jgi:hypothetical protein
LQALSSSLADDSNNYHEYQRRQMYRLDSGDVTSGRFDDIESNRLARQASNADFEKNSSKHSSFHEGDRDSDEGEFKRPKDIHNLN